MAQQRFDFTLGLKVDTTQAVNSMNDLASIINKIASHPPALLDDQDLKDASKSAQELQKHLSAAVNVNTGKLDLSKFSQSLSKSGKDLTYFQKNLSKLGVEGEQAFLKLAENIAMAEVPTLRLNGHLKNFLDELVKVGRWQLSSNIMHGLQGAVQTAYHYAQDLNESLTNIRIVTGQNTEEMAQFAKRANDAAKALSTTTTSYSDAALIFYQQGLNEAEVEERTNATIKMANATGQGVQTVSDQLTAVWNNFDDGSKSLEYYADVMAKLGAETASSTEEIATGIEKFASISNMIGLSYEYAASALTTVTDVTRQSADVVGTAFKTIFARIQGLNLGDTLEDGTTLNKYSKALEAVGISIFDQNNQLKDMDDILDEMGAKWQMLGRDQQVALAQTVAGVRQYNQLVSLMENWDFFKRNVDSARSSEGALTEQANIYAESWEASIDRVRASAEGIYDNLIDEELFIKINNIFADLLDGVNGLITGFGGFGGIISSVGGLFLTYFSKKMPGVISNLTNNFNILTGRAKKSMDLMQKENLKNLATFVPERSSEELAIYQEGLSRVAEMKRELSMISDQLTEEELQENQERIKLTQSIYAEAAALQRMSDEAKQAKNNLTRDTQIQTGVNLTGFKTNYTKQMSEVHALQKKGDNRTESEQRRLVKLNEEIEKTRKNYQDLDRIINKISNGKVKASTGNQNGLFDSKNFDDINKLKKIDEYFEQASVAINETKTQFMNLVAEGGKYQAILDAIGHEQSAWKTTSLDLDEAKKSVTAYVNEFEKLIAQDDMSKLGKNDSIQESIQFIKQFLNEAKSVDEVQEKFLVFLREIEGQTSEAFTESSNSAEEFRKDLIDALSTFKGADEAKKEIDSLGQRIQELSEEEFAALLSKLGLTTAKMEDVKNHAYKTSEAFMDFAGILMDLNGALSGGAGLYTTYTDESASASDKISTSLGTIATSIFSIVQLVNVFKKIGAAASVAGKAAGGFSKVLAGLGGPAGIIAAIGITAVTTALGAYFESRKAATEAEQEHINTLKESVKEQKDIIISNNDLIKQMESLLETYRETGEGKDELDSLTQKLATTYGLEGAALADLTGNYQDYLSVLNQAKQDSKNQTKQQAKDAKDVANAKGAEIKEIAASWENKVDWVDGNYSLGVSKIGGSSKRDKPKYDAFIQQMEEEFKDSDFQFSSNSKIHGSQKSYYTGGFKINFQNADEITPDKLVEIYDKIKQYENNEIYGDLVKEFINDLGGDELIQQYKEARQEYQNLNFLSKDFNIQSYDDYLDWLEEATQVTENLGLDSQEASKFISDLVASSGDFKLDKYYELDSIINSILPTTNQYGIDKSYIANIFKEIESGVLSYDKLTIASLNWSVLDKKNWRQAADAIQNYNDAIKDTQTYTDLRAGAEQAYELIEEDGITEKNQEEIKASIDWGNTELGIIEFTEFLRLSAEEQKQYLKELSDINLFDYWENQIKKSTDAIGIYEQQTNAARDLLKADLDVANIFAPMTEAANRGASGDEFLEARQQSLAKYNELIKKYPGLTEYFKDFADFEKRYSELDYLIEDEDFLIKMGIDSIQFEKDARETAKTAEENVELELTTRPSEDGVEYLRKKISELKLELNPDASNFNEVMDEILSKQYQLKIQVEAVENQNIQKYINDMSELNSAISQIGDNWTISKDAIQDLEKVLPGALKNYEVLADGKIKLDDEQIISLLNVRKTEADSHLSKIKLYQSSIDTQIEVLKQEKKNLLSSLTAYKNGESSKTDVLNTASQARINIEEATGKAIEAESALVANDVKEDTVEVGEEVANTATKKAIVEFEYFKSVADWSTDNTELLLEQAKLILSANNAARAGDVELLEYFSQQFQGKDWSNLVRYNIALVQGRVDESGKIDFNGTSTVNTREWEKQTEEEKKAQLDKRNAAIQTAQEEFSDEAIEASIKAQIKAIDDEITNLEASKNSTNAEKAAAEAVSKEAENIINNIASGKGADGVWDNKSSSEYQETDKEYNPYQNVDNTIEQLNTKLQEQKEITAELQEGSDEHLAALESERRLIEEINKYQTEKLNIANGETERLKSELVAFGAQYDAETQKITNYDELINAKLQQVDAINKRLTAASTDEEREKLEEELKYAEAQADKAKELADEYNDTIDIINDINGELRKNNNEIKESVELSKEASNEFKQWYDDLVKAEKELDKLTQSLDDEIDKYYQINKLLDEQTDKLKDLEYARDSSYGKSWLNNQDNYIKGLQEEQNLQKENAEISKKLHSDYGQRAANAFNSDIYYDKNGMVSNYEELMEKANAPLREKIDAERAAYEAYEATSSEDDKRALEIATSEREAAENTRNEQIDLINSINEYAQNYKDAQDRQEEIARQILDENYQTWEYKMNVRIELDDMELKQLNKDLEKLEEDIFSMSEAASMIADDFTKHYRENVASLNEERANLEALYQAGEITQEKYVAGLKEISSEIEKAIDDIEELDEKMMNYYGDTLEKANEELEFYTSQMEHLTDVLDHYKNIVELINGEYDYERMGILLEGQAHNLENEMEVATKWFETLDKEKAEIEATLADPGLSDEERKKLQEAYKPIYEAWMEAHDDMLSKTTEWVEATKAVMENTMAQAARELELAMTDGIGFDALNNSMDRLNEYSNIYLTKTNQVYEIQKMMRTAAQAADKTDNAASKERLKNFMNELGDLQEKNQLSNLELEIAQKKYDLLEAQIALEETQNAKNTVRLQRDSNGNFGYVYTADQTAVAEAEEKVYEAEQELYNLALESTNDYAQKRIELQESLYNDLVQLEENRVAGMYATEEEYNQAREQLIKEYNDLFIAYEDQYNLALEADGYLRLQIADRQNKQQLKSANELTNGLGQDLQQRSTNILLETGIQKETWTTHYNNVLELTKTWRKNTNLEYEGSAKEVQNWATLTAGYLTQCETAYTKWQGVVTTQNSYVQTALSKTKDATNKVKEASDSLNKALVGDGEKEGLVKALGKELEAVKLVVGAYITDENNLLKALGLIKKAYEDIRLAIEKANEVSLNPPKYDEDDFKKSSPDISKNNNDDNNKNYNNNDSNNDNNGNNNDNGDGNNNDNSNNNDTNNNNNNNNNNDNNDNNTNSLGDVAYAQAMMWQGKWSESQAISYSGLSKTSFRKVTGYLQNQTTPSNGTAYFTKAFSDTNLGSDYWKNFSSGWNAIENTVEARDKINQELINKGIVSGATGMYTGAWGPEGRLAILHEKEIVLNKEDTKNFLHATDILRSIANVIDLNAMSNQLANLSATVYSGTNGSLEQSVHIEANFPNATDRNEIEEAFNNLINTASQYANRKNI